MDTPFSSLLYTPAKQVKLSTRGASSQGKLLRSYYSSLASRVGPRRWIRVHVSSSVLHSVCLFAGILLASDVSRLFTYLDGFSPFSPIFWHKIHDASKSFPRTILPHVFSPFPFDFSRLQKCRSRISHLLLFYR